MKCNYHPKPLTKEEQAEFKIPSNKSTLPYIYRLQYEQRNREVRTEDFEELKQIAEEEFGCTIINSTESKTFEDIFGFGMSNINENPEISLEESFNGGF